MIVVRQHPEEGTTTPEKSCCYVAECTTGGRVYTARSRHGAVNELARVLVEAGVPDAPMAVTQQGLKGDLTYPSLHAAAALSYEETSTKPLHRVRWEDPAIRRARLAAALPKTGGVTAPAATSGPSGLFADVSRTVAREAALQEDAT